MPAGSFLTEDPRVDRVTFAGESGTGKIIMQAAGSHLAPVSLELGGKVANIVLDDADLDNTVHWAVGLANDTRYGVNAMLFTENLSRAHRVSSRLRAGTVWGNCFFIRGLRTPFSGVRDSGVGREGGTFSREFFTEPKAVVMQIDGG